MAEAEKSAFYKGKEAAGVGGENNSIENITTRRQIFP